MSPVEVRPRPAPSSSAIALLPYGLAAIAAVVLAVVAAGLARGPAFVDRVDVVNRSPYELLVDIQRGPDEGWVRIGYIDQDASTSVREVLDQGDRWTFRFRAQGREGGRITLSRADLARADWRLDVPAEVEARLRAAGAPPSP